MQPHRLTGKSYTRFVQNSNKVQSNGMYKFPAFKLGSMVKSQNLSFKVPDSMAVTAAYGSNKNKSTGIRVDTTNTYPELETFFESDDRVPDSRLDGLKKLLGLLTKKVIKLVTKAVMMML